MFDEREETIVWKDGWMVGWMDEWMDGWMDERASEVLKTVECPSRSRHRPCGCLLSAGPGQVQV